MGMTVMMIEEQVRKIEVYQYTYSRAQDQGEFKEMRADDRFR